jgi:hypothetical protein
MWNLKIHDWIEKKGASNNMEIWSWKGLQRTVVGMGR